MNTFSYKTKSSMVIMLFIISFFSCERKFDAPPVYTEPAINSNMTIQELRNLHSTGSFENITDDKVIEGVVIADDSQDNFYKSLVIQDRTGGITIRMDGFSLYNVYPVKTKIYIRLKGLWIGDYGGNVQLGAGVDRADPASPQLTTLPQSLFTHYIVKGVQNVPVEPKTVTIGQLNDSLQSQLITISNAEFAIGDTGRPYADAINKQTINRTVKTCDGGSIYIRTSGYAKFAKINTPRGNGTITGVYTVFKTEKQLLVRDTSDIHFTGLRCTGGGSKTLFMENFESAVPGDSVLLPDWKNMAENGGKKYQGKRVSNNTYAEISAFATGQATIVTWLIMPPVNLSNTTNEVLTFKTKDAYDNGAVLKVLVSGNYDGGTAPWKAKWIPLTSNVSKGSISGVATNWMSSGNINLNGYSGNIYIAFRYEGADPANAGQKHTTTFRLDEIAIIGN